MQRQTAIAILTREAVRLRQQYGLAHISLFGSVARGEGKARSDVDVLAEFDRPVSLFELVRIQGELEGALGCKVDLATPGRIGPRLRRNIERDLIRVA